MIKAVFPTIMYVKKEGGLRQVVEQIHPQGSLPFGPTKEKISSQKKWVFTGNISTMKDSELARKNIP